MDQVDLQPDSGAIQNLNSPSRLGNTKYKVAVTPRDYQICHNLADKEGFLHNTYSFPTIMAIKEGELVGFISTHIEGESIVCGPLVVKTDRNHAMTLVRLVEAYDLALRSMGIEWYIFHTPKNGKLEQLAEKIGFKPYEERDGEVFFLRDLMR